MSSIAQLKQKARSFEQREQWTAALEVYEQMVASQPEGEDLDVGVWNRIGDLHMRLGQTDRAVAAYEHAVQSYSEAGLHNNAIALCNKILRVTPGRPAIYLKLAQISSLKGFLADARQHLASFVERMRSAGQLDSALETLVAAAEADAEEPVLRRIAAEQLQTHGREPEALRLFAAAHRLLVDRGLDVEAEAVWAQIRGLDPSAQPVSAPRRATAEAEPLTLINGEESQHGPSGAEFDADAVDGLDTMLDLSAFEQAGGSAGGLEEITPLDGLEVTSRSAELPELPAEGSAASADQPDEALLDLDIVSTDLGSSASPDDVEAGSLLDAAASDEEPAAFDSVGPADGLIADFGATADDADETDDGYVDLVGFDSGSDAAAELPRLDADFDALDIRIDGDEAATAAADADVEADSESLPFLSLPEIPAESGSDREYGFDGPEFSFAGDDELDAAGESLPSLDSGAEGSVADELARARARLDRDPSDVAAARELVVLLSSVGTDDRSLHKLDETVQTLAGAGRFDEAVDLVRALIELHPASTTLFQKQVELAFRADDQPLLIRAYLDLAGHLAAQGDEEKERAVYERVLELDPDNAAARRGLGFPEAPEPAAESPEYVDLAALIFEDEPEPGRTRFVVEADEPTGDDDGDFAEILARFREQVAQNIDAADSASHYDLGVAFKEMGLLDEAISEFQTALRGGAHPVATLEMLGECFVAQGQHAVGWRLLDRALSTAGMDDADLVGVLYWKGRCDEALGRVDSAAESYERVLAVDVEFRDVADRLRAVRATSSRPSL